MSVPSIEQVHGELETIRPRSAALYAEACRVIPGGTVSRARILPPFPFLATHGRGARLYDVDENEYIDCTLGFGSNLLGHAHPVVVEAIRESALRGTAFGTPHPAEGELARLLVDMIPCAEQVTFCNSGSEATLNAIRIARAVTGRTRIAKFEGGYHGWYDAVLGSITHDPERAGPADAPEFVGHSIGVPPENTVHTLVLPFNHQSALDTIRREASTLAVVLVEGIQGAGGAIPVEQWFLRELRRVCTECGVLLLIDEIITGFRLAAGGAQEYFGVTADLATYSKAVGAGLPLGIIAGTHDVMRVLGSTGNPVRDRLEKVYYGGTFNGNVQAMAVGVAVLRYLRAHPDVYGQLNALGHAVRQGLRQVVEKEGYPVTVLGDGSLFMSRMVTHPVRSHRDFAGERTSAYLQMFPRLLRHGVFLPNAHFGLVSTAHTDDDVARIVEAHARVFEELRELRLL
ncbi:glutamate-1-semialdehyde 2,1-aminomutase [soil metagenome]